MIHKNKKYYDNVIKMPTLDEAQGTLSALEKSLLGHFIALTRPRVILELGVMDAITTKFMLEFLIINEINAEVVGFDLPEVVSKLRSTNKFVQQKEKDKMLQLIPGVLPMSLDSWLKNSGEEIDLVLVDANHSYRNVVDELSLLWSKLSTDGYILCHDYSSKYDGVRYAVDRFSSKRNVMVLPLSASNRTIEFGQGSVLVALHKRSHRFTTRRWMHHYWLGMKSNLLRIPIFERAWSKFIKPLIKGGKS